MISVFIFGEILKIKIMKSKDNPLKKAKSVSKRVIVERKETTPAKKTNYLKKGVDIVSKDTIPHRQLSPSGKLEEKRRVDANKKLPLNYKKLKAAQAIKKNK